jgi:uncharacterized protein YprB with RNaseH-like and TPR domain
MIAPPATRPVERDVTREQLRRMIRRIEQRGQSVTFSSAPPPSSLAPAQLHELLPDVVLRETDTGPCTYREVAYPIASSIGAQPLDELAHAAGESLEALAPGEDLAGATPEELLFLDIETTGLGGAGAIAFAVATGRIEGGSFVLRQYLALSPPEEAGLLDALIEDSRLDEEPVLVTYNGRSFDAPVLDGRATMHRRRTGFESLRQLDLLYPARRMFRGLFESCRLSVIESAVLGVARHEMLHAEDVHGSDVPGWYFRWLRTGDARWLAPIASHNEIDVVSLGGLAGWFGASLTGQRQVHGVEALALGRLHMANRDPRAEATLSRALDELTASTARHEALMRLAAVHKRAGRRDLAEPRWVEAADAGETSTRELATLEPLVELAKYYEHELHDFAAALRVVERALCVVETLLERHDRAQALRWSAMLEHRQSRLVRRHEAALAAQ